MRKFRSISGAVIVAALIFISNLSATTVTGTVRLGGVRLNGKMCLTLSHPAQNQAMLTVSAPAPQCYSIANGQVPNGVVVEGNDVLSPTGTYYLAEFRDVYGTLRMRAPYLITGSTFDIGAASPSPISITSNDLRITSFVGIDSINGVKHVTNTTTGANAGAKIQNTISSCPTTGCVIMVNLYGEQTATSQIVIDRPVAIYFDEITLNVTTEDAIKITSSTGHVGIFGTPGKTVISGANRSSGSSINYAMIQADYLGSSQPSGFVVSGIKFVGGANTVNNYKVGIRMRNVTKAYIRDNEFEKIDTPDAGAGDAYNIQVTDASTHVDIENNVIKMVESTIATVPFRIGILIQSPVVDATNGLYTGASPLLPTTMYINVRGNRIIGGTHGYNPQNIAYSNFTGNYAQGQGHRNMIISGWKNHDITVTGNEFRNAGSVNLIGSGYNITVVGNIMDTTYGSEGNNIEIYYDPEDWLISGNQLSNAAINGILVGYKAKRITIVNNQIKDFSTVGVTGYAGVKVIGALGASYPDTIPGGGIIEDIYIAGNTITNTLSDGHTRHGVYILGKDTGTVQGDTPFSRVVVGTNYITNINYGFTAQKNGDAASWEVAVMNQYFTDVLNKQSGDYTDDSLGGIALEGELRMGNSTDGIGKKIRFYGTAASADTNIVQSQNDDSSLNIQAGTTAGWTSKILVNGRSHASLPGIRFYTRGNERVVIDDTTGALLLKVGIGQDAGFKHQRVAGCTTAAAAGAVCTTVVTWTNAFGDTNYSVSCSGSAVGGGVPVLGGLSAKAAGSVTVRTVAVTAVAASYTNIECIAVHD